MNDIQIYKKFQKSPLFFIQTMWGLVPERNNSKFIKGKHLTAQQHDILLAVEAALQDGKKRISIASGHGIGKSATLSWLLLWYLFCYKDAQVACTAPTSQQLYDILWKEVALWLGKMPKPIQNLYEWGTTHIRIKERAETWFARAATARKEAPEALAGVHGEFVLFLVDEASGVDDMIYKTAEGSLTNEKAIVILISNPTRLTGYFHESHHGDKQSWQTFQFSSLDSPLVDKEYNDRIKEKNGEDSDEYKIRVLGQFPKADAVDDKGYVPLLLESDLHQVDEREFSGEVKMGVDPSGVGDDVTAWVGRDRLLARILGEEKISNEKSIAQTTITLMEQWGMRDYNVGLDDFGVGSKVAREVALTGSDGTPQGMRINAVNVGDKPEDDSLYLNKRAELYFRLKEWLRSGGELVRDERWKELLSIRFRRELNGKLRIMSKEDMRRSGIKSPNFADALSLTFLRREEESYLEGQKQYRPKLKTYTN